MRGSIDREDHLTIGDDLHLSKGMIMERRAHDGDEHGHSFGSIDQETEFCGVLFNDVHDEPFRYQHLSTIMGKDVDVVY